MGKAAQNRKKADKGKKVAPPEETPLWGPRIKNPTTSSPHTSPPSDADDDIESSLEEDISEDVLHTKKVDATLIDRKNPLLALTTALVPIIEWWRYLGM